MRGVSLDYLLCFFGALLGSAYESPPERTLNSVCCPWGFTSTLETLGGLGSVGGRRRRDRAHRLCLSHHSPGYHCLLNFTRPRKHCRGKPSETLVLSFSPHGQCSWKLQRRPACVCVLTPVAFYATQVVMSQQISVCVCVDHSGVLCCTNTYISTETRSSAVSPSISQQAPVANRSPSEKNDCQVGDRQEKVV